MDNKIVKLDIFGVPCEIELQDIDIKAFENLKELQNAGGESIDDLVNSALKLEETIKLVIGDKFPEVMKGKKRSLKTYTEIATALKNSMENMKQ